MRMGRLGAFSRAFGGVSDGINRDHSLAVSTLPILAATGASMVTRTCSRRAFEVERRGLVTQDMLPHLAKAFTEVFGEDVQDGERGRL